MKICFVIALWMLGLSGPAMARRVPVTLWVSGGLEGVVMGGRAAPGQLGVAAHVKGQEAAGCWLDAGGAFHPLLREIDGLPEPDAEVPGEDMLRWKGVEGLDPELHTLSNVRALPQFPEWTPPVSSSRDWVQSDGVGWRIYGLLSAKAPLRIPPGQLRPLRVDSPLTSLRTLRLQTPEPETLAAVLVLPEGEDPAEWSRNVPDIPVLVEPPGSSPEIIEAANGSQVRVRPVRHGRAVIRVWMIWDTVTKTFGPPRAEVEWVRAPALGHLDLPEEIRERIRGRNDLHARNPEKELLARADVVLVPEMGGKPVDSTLPDAVRATAVPRDHAWMRFDVPGSLFASMRAFSVNGAAWRKETHNGQNVSVLIPARYAAGNGRPGSPLRRFLERHPHSVETMPFTTRELVVPVEDRL